MEEFLAQKEGNEIERGVGSDYGIEVECLAVGLTSFCEFLEIEMKD
jgi:hypothetical protein